VFSSTNVVEMFPTYVWVHDLEPDQATSICDKIYAALEKNMPPMEKLAGGHSVQSGTAMHKDPAFRELMGCVDGAAQNVLQFLGHKQEKMIVTGCWANISGPNAHHKEHSHPNHFLSGVFYVKAPKGGDSINFHDPRAEAHVIAPHFEKPSIRNVSTMFVEAKASRMMIFPSWLRHSVAPNEAAGLRISIAFNLMFRRYGETQSQPRFSGSF